MNPLDQAIESVGGVSELARRLSVGQSVVSNWRQRGRVPLEACPNVESVQDAVRCEDLRPDVTWQRDDAGNVTGYVVPIAPSEAKAA